MRGWDRRGPRRRHSPRLRRTRSRLRRWARLPRRLGLAHLGALAGGALAFLSLPPIGWWPAGIVGVGLLFAVLRGAGARRRIACGWLFGAGLLIPGVVWVISFTAPGYPIVVLVEGAFYALAALLTPPGRGRTLAFPAAVAGAEMLRDIWPFGGVPLSELSLGQAAGPLAPLARLGGSALLTGAEAAIGACLATLLTAALGRLDEDRPRRSVAAGLVAAGLVVAATVGAALAPDGGPATGHLVVAAVQGGGPRGLRAVNENANLPFVAQLRAMGRVRTPVRLVVWPENVLDLGYPLDGSSQDAEMRQLAQTDDTTILAGVTQPVGATRFLNEVFAWTADGGRIGPYQKVHRVPFGEYIPFRSILRHLANLSDVPRDAIPGHGPGYLVTPAGRLGIMISWEVFFDQRSLAAVRAGARVLTVPTNASSYSTGQVPSMELAAARLRAIGAGRDLVQSAPTGYSALIDNRGRVLARSSLGAEQVLEATLSTRRGYTVFDHLGLGPERGLAAAAVAAGWVLGRAERRARRRW